MAAETDTQAASIANETGITPTSLQSTLEAKLQAEQVFVEDISGTPPSISLLSAAPERPTNASPKEDAASPSKP